MSKGGGGGGAQTVTQKSDPPAYLAPYLTEAAKAASNIYAKGAVPLYPNQTYAPINATQQAGLDATLAYGNSGQNEYTNDSLKALQGAVNSDPSQGNPYLDKLLQTYGEKANQMVAGNFNTAGRYGSGAHAAAAGTAISNATLPILSQQYNTDMTNKLNSAALLPSLASQQDKEALTKAQAIGSVGDIYAGQDQNAINEAITRFQSEHGGAENDALNNYLKQLGLTSGLNSGQSTTTTGAKSQGIGGTIGNIVSGLGAIGGLGTGLGSFLGGGSALAAGLGGSAGTLGSIASVLGIFSDERLKENIEHVGYENGHKLYEFNYKSTPTRYVGVMAQEVLKTHPEAVVQDKFGYMKVNYDILGVKFREAGTSVPSRATAPASVGGHVEAGAAGSAIGGI